MIKTFCQRNDRPAQLTLSRSESVDFRAPSGRPKGKQNLKLVIWCSRSTLSLSLMTVKSSFSSWVTVPTPSGLQLRQLFIIVDRAEDNVQSKSGKVRTTTLMKYEDIYVGCGYYEKKVVQGLQRVEWI